MRDKNAQCGLFGDIRGKRVLDRFTLAERVYPPNFSTPDHSHQFAVFTFVLGGRYTEVFGAKRRECERATALFHPGGDLHAEHFSGEGGRLFVIEFAPEWVSDLKKRINFPTETSQVRGGRLAALGARAYAEFERFDEFSPVVLEGLMIEVIGEAGRLLERRSASKGPRWLEDVETIIRQRFDEPLTLEKIAGELRVHPVHLAQTFKRFRDSTVGEYLREMRLESARENLKFTSRPISQIASQCGFSDQSHLSRLFKARYGITPRRYRESV